jgi:hypothetical protein
MNGRERRRFERHLLECQTCWEEVRLDRAGRRIAETGRSVAPPELREMVRAAVAGNASDDLDARVASPRSRRRTVLLPAIASGVVVIVLAVWVLLLRPATEPAPITAALSAYEHSAVEGAHQDMPMPDISSIGLRPTGAEHMLLDDMPVEAFAYRTDSGSRLALFMRLAPFPRAVEARSVAASTWQAEHGGIVMLSGPVRGGSPAMAFLAVTNDPALMDDLAGALASGQVVIAA